MSSLPLDLVFSFTPSETPLPGPAPGPAAEDDAFSDHLAPRAAPPDDVQATDHPAGDEPSSPGTNSQPDVQASSDEPAAVTESTKHPEAGAETESSAQPVDASEQNETPETDADAVLTQGPIVVTSSETPAPIVDLLDGDPQQLATPQVDLAVDLEGSPVETGTQAAAVHPTQIAVSSGEELPTALSQQLVSDTTGVAAVEQNTEVAVTSVDELAAAAVAPDETALAADATAQAVTAKADVVPKHATSKQNPAKRHSDAAKSAESTGDDGKQPADAPTTPPTREPSAGTPRRAEIETKSATGNARAAEPLATPTSESPVSTPQIAGDTASARAAEVTTTEVSQVAIEAEAVQPTTSRADQQHNGLAGRIPSHLQARDDGAARRIEITDAQQARLLQRVARAFDAARQRGGPLRLRLSPPELGSVQLEVKVEQGVMTARIEAETPQAQHLLANNLATLRERLAEQGIRVEQFDVDLMQRHDQDGGGPTEDAQQQHHHRTRQSNRTVDATATPESGNAAPSTGPDDDGQLNVII